MEQKVSKKNLQIFLKLYFSWDEWVPAKRVLKFNSENLKKQKQLQNDAKKKVTLTGKKNAKHYEGFSSCSSTCSTSDTASITYSSEKSMPRSRKRPLQPEAGQETVENKKICVLDLDNSEKLKTSETNMKKVKIVIPESLRLWLIDDFDFIIQQNKIMRLPARNNVEKIFNNYIELRKNKNSLEEEYSSLNESHFELDKKYVQYLDETINGLIKYFNEMIGSQLLYKFERLQYSEVNLKIRLKNMYFILKIKAYQNGKTNVSGVRTGSFFKTCW